MKWMFLKRRSEVQEPEIQVSPVSGTYSNNAAPIQEQLDERADHGSSSNWQGQPDTEVPLPALHAGPAPSKEQQNDQKPVDVGSTSNEQDALQAVLLPIQGHLDEQKRACSTSNQQDQPDIEVPLPTLQVGPAPTEEQQNEQTPVDVGSTSHEQDEVSKNGQSTLQRVPAPIQEEFEEQNRVDPGSFLQQNEQKRIDMVLSEIQIILTERPPIQKAGTRQGSAALPVLQNDDLDARVTMERKSAIPLNANHAERKLKKSEISEPVAQEIEALLGISKEPIPDNKTQVDAVDAGQNESSNAGREEPLAVGRCPARSPGRRQNAAI
jgi:hypothetical protein